MAESPFESTKLLVAAFILYTTLLFPLNLTSTGPEIVTVPWIAPIDEGWSLSPSWKLKAILLSVAAIYPGAFATAFTSELVPSFVSKLPIELDSLNVRAILSEAPLILVFIT